MYKYISLYFSESDMYVCVLNICIFLLKLPINLFLMEYAVHVFSKNVIMYYFALSWFVELFPCVESLFSISLFFNEM